MWPESNMSRTEFSEHSRVKLSVKIIFRLIKEDYIFKNIWVKMFVLAIHFISWGFWFLSLMSKRPSCFPPLDLVEVVCGI